ncbi:MAG: DinB family protein [Bryobacteraceae bacterium]
MASEANPYSKHLGARDPLEVMASTPHRVRQIFEQLGPQGEEKTYEPGKWSAREIICHLADCEVAFAFRLRQTLAEPNHVIQPFDQELWARNYATLDAAAALSSFVALRAWNQALLKTLSPEDFNIPAKHPERGAMTFRTIVETIGGHDLNHLGQLERIASNGVPK